jgi:hypothetical protein
MHWPSIARAELIVSASLRSTCVPSGPTETPLVTGARATAGVMIVAEVGADDGGVTVADGGTGVGEEAGPPL